MPEFQLSLAPSQLSQVINPWTWNLFTINLGQSSDPALENRILDEVGTYGRQIGQIGDAMRVLISLVDQGLLTDAQKDALRKLEDQLQHVDVLKEARRLEKRMAASGGVTTA